ncbi:MAG: hypothetical protein ABI417_07305 [Coleofasciculaceae cyanobacterium]
MFAINLTKSHLKLLKTDYVEAIKPVLAEIQDQKGDNPSGCFAIAYIMPPRQCQNGCQTNYRLNTDFG